MTTPETRSFHIGDILTVTTGLLVSPRHVDGLYDLLGWMTDDTLWTHQLPRASDECKPHLLAQHPDLVDLPEPTFPEVGAAAAVAGWLDEQIARFGEYRDVARLPKGDHTSIHPLTELAMNYPDKEVIAIEVPGDRS